MTLDILAQCVHGVYAARSAALHFSEVLLARDVQLQHSAVMRIVNADQGAQARGTDRIAAFLTKGSPEYVLSRLASMSLGISRPVSSPAVHVCRSAG